MAKITIPKLKSSMFKGWAFVLVAGLVLAFLALVDRGGLDGFGTAAIGSGGCQVEVSADELNVRSEPSQEAALVETLTRGQRMAATRVVTDGYRQLDDARWAADQFLTPLPGTNCA